MQVLANLLSNAAKFSPLDDKVLITVTPHDDTVRVAVADHGMGIPDEFRDRIFNKFAQADASDTRQKGGTGLGLNIAKSMVERMGGRIGFESTPGAGSTFYFYLPLYREVAQATAETAKTETLPALQSNLQPTAKASKLGRILICEDDGDIARLLSIMLSHEGFDTDIARNAGEAKELIGRNQCLAMTLDLGLPQQSGISLIRELREQEQAAPVDGQPNAAGPHLPIIVVSATALEGRAELNGAAFGVVDWLEKPINPQHLAIALQESLRRMRDSATPKPSKSQPADVPAHAKARILHVEDESDVILVTAVLLEDIAEVECASTLQAARQKLEQERFDLVIIDVALPDGSGLELLPLISQCSPPVPAMIFSAQEVQRDLPYKLAGNIVKSRSSNQELLDTIKALIQPRQPAPGEQEEDYGTR